MKNKNVLIYVGIIAMILVVGITYAFFTYQRTGGNNQLITGEIYLNFEEENAIYLLNAFPETKAEGLANEENYLEFNISGKNTSKKDINYVIKINHGENLSGKTRLKDKDIRVNLECDGETIVDAARYNEWDDTIIALATIPAGTNEEITKNYTLRIWINEDVLISDTDSNANYTTDVYKNSFASIKVTVEGKTGEIAKSLMDEIETKQANYLTEADAFGNRYISGTSSEITNNYVKFSNKIWRIVGINADGTIKLITESSMDYRAWDSEGNTDYATSEIREWLNDEFLGTLNQDLIATSTFNYTGISETFSVGEIKMLQDKVGLLSAFDYVGVIGLDLSTGNMGNMNDNYLISGQDTWTMALEITSNGIFYINDDGSVMYYYSPKSSSGVRPVVNVLSTTKFIEGDGSKENPYVIVGEEGIGDIYNYNDDFEITKLTNLAEADMNGTKYVVGTVEDNYVWYSGKLWRVVALNGDGTTKLVTQNNITSIAWDINNSNNYENSQMRSWLNNEFLKTIDNKLITTSEWDYEYGIANDKVGLLTLSEYYATGGSYYSDSTNTYLNIGYYWWLMTPYTTDGNAWNVWYVSGDGYAGNGGNAADGFAARPSVNLISDIQIKGGTGTASNPYRIEGDKEIGTTGELLNNRVSGEYIKFNNTLYRIVGIETINNQKLTKITMADYSVNKNSINTSVQFGSTNDAVGATFTKESGIGKYLDDWYTGTDIASEYKTMIATDADGVLWYQGPENGTGYDYTKSKSGTGISATIGLPYYGEMFSTQFGPGYEDSTWTWFMTKGYSAQYVWDVYNDGEANGGFGATGAGAVRPSMYLKSTVKLGDTTGDGKVGEGTASSPYEIVIG